MLEISGLIIIFLGINLMFFSPYGMSSSTIGFLLFICGLILLIIRISEIPQYKCLNGNLYKIENGNYLNKNQKCEILNESIYIRDLDGNLLKPYESKEVF